METKKQLKTKLLNDLIAVCDKLDEVWQYHKDNPNRVSPEQVWEYCSEQRKQLGKQLDSLNNEQDIPKS